MKYKTQTNSEGLTNSISAFACVAGLSGHDVL